MQPSGVYSPDRGKAGIMIELTGQRFGRLTVRSYSHSNDAAYWNCVCDCGNTSVVKGTSLRYGSTKSCGCGQKEQAVKNVIASAAKRNLGYKHRLRLQGVLHGMRARCLNQSDKRWDRYGGRGITICAEWLAGNRAFYAWAMANGYEPGLEIDRIDFNGNYCPENCRFVTDKVQANNTSRNHYVTWNGETLTVAQWADRIGVRSQALQHRFSRGWPLERAMTQPFRRW